MMRKKERKTISLCYPLVIATIFKLLFYSGCENIGENGKYSEVEQSYEQETATQKSIELTASVEDTESWRVETKDGIYEILSNYPIPNIENDTFALRMSTPIIDFESLSSENQDSLIIELEAFVADRLAVKPKPPKRILNPNWMNGYVVETDEDIIVGDMILSKSQPDSYSTIQGYIYQSYGIYSSMDTISKGMTISMVASWDNDVYIFCIADQPFIWTLDEGWNCNPLDTTPTDETTIFRQRVQDWRNAANNEFDFMELQANHFYWTIWPVSEFVMVGECADPSFTWDGGYASRGPRERAGCIFDDRSNDAEDQINNNYVALHEIGHNLGFYHEHERSDRDDYINTTKPISYGYKRTSFDLWSVMIYPGIDLTPLGEIIYNSVYSPPTNYKETQAHNSISTMDAEAIRILY